MNHKFSLTSGSDLIHPPVQPSLDLLHLQVVCPPKLKNILSRWPFLFYTFIYHKNSHKKHKKLISSTEKYRRLENLLNGYMGLYMFFPFIFYSLRFVFRNLLEVICLILNLSSFIFFEPLILNITDLNSSCGHNDS